jgi:hypothetical protein
VEVDPRVTPLPFGGVALIHPRRRALVGAVAAASTFRNLRCACTSGRSASARAKQMVLLGPTTDGGTGPTLAFTIFTGCRGPCSLSRVSGRDPRPSCQARSALLF